ncbi:acetyl-CoA carboxylase biotin carboxyl carrier protein [Blattabacterium cuenoti]|uniref:Biotin carboxyl carrier protein of acetyl-CoA carboxylase n=1 Tax=Blattabacterium cuenoti STAT TaxID=1457030 RepID=A0A224AKA2_9FLAO|nr:acetyl-CoA carboxylase biotin carboxyl carrier protein [Blattabacterium cuenoti]BBA17060.1 acetyl-CoA carboxylase, biotin carboxyl carrier protein [Blattabacterium cuenoti STAT]
MDFKKIKSLIQFISDSNIDEIRIKIENTEIYMKNKELIKKEKYSWNSNFSPTKMSLSSSSSISDSISDFSTDRFCSNTEKEKKNQYLTIKSPMIGTFYRKPHPDQNPFIKIGDKVKIGTKVCVIEAMKLFNDIESEINGKLIKVLVEDATPVDYDQPLFLLDPNY